MKKLFGIKGASHIFHVGHLGLVVWATRMEKAVVSNINL